MTTPTTDDLPPLPGHLGFADVVRAAGPVYTADQMREYARAAPRPSAPAGQINPDSAGQGMEGGE